MICNFVIGQKLSEYHTGFRGFTREILEKLPLEDCSDDFIFDNQMILEAFKLGYDIEEVYCPGRYLNSSSSINFTRSLKYGFGVVCNTFKYFFK